MRLPNRFSVPSKQPRSAKRNGPESQVRTAGTVLGNQTIKYFIYDSILKRTTLQYKEKKQMKYYVERREPYNGIKRKQRVRTLGKNYKRKKNSANTINILWDM